MQLDWLEARFKVAMVDYYIAQTYPVPEQKPDQKPAKEDPADKPRKEAYAKAAKSLDEIHQENRDRMVGVYALMWQGKCLDELGDYDTAADMYDEVLAFGPDSPTDQITGMEQLLAQAMQFRLNMIVRQKGLKKFIEEADRWLKPFGDPARGRPNPMIKAWREADGFQGVCLDLAKAFLEEAGKVQGEERSKLKRKAVDILKQMVKVRSDHAAEAMQLLNQNAKFAGANIKVEPKNFDEAVLLGEAASAAGEYKDAVEYLEKAMSLGEKLPAKDKKRLPEVQNKLDTARFQLAVSLFRDKTLAQSLEIAERLAHERERSEMRTRPPQVGRRRRFRLYVTARGTYRYRRGGSIASTSLPTSAIKHWPREPETDGVRIHRGHLCLANDEWQKAIESFNEVSDRSASRGEALRWTGFAHMQLYRQERKNSEEKRDAKRMAREQAAAEKALRESLEKQGATVDKAVDALPKDLFETQLLLCELLMEVGQSKDAAEFAAPLVAKIKAQTPEDRSRDEATQRTTQRTCIVAMRANMALQQGEKAGEVVSILTDSGADLPQANQPLCQFARMVDNVVKEASRGSDRA